MVDWSSSLSQGLLNWCDHISNDQVDGVAIVRFRPRCPLLLLSGATPGPFYHSHPHISSEFDHLCFELEDQINANIQTIRRIADAALQAPLPFQVPPGCSFAQKPLLINWVSGNGAGHTHNLRVVEDITPLACRKAGMDQAMILNCFATGGNVSDRRFLLETFAMFGLEESALGDDKACTRIDLWGEFDSVEGDIYTVNGKQYFMPYVPGYMLSGAADLALFRVAAGIAQGEPALAPEDQIQATVEQLLRVLQSLGADFSDVVVLWNRCMMLDEIENSVLTMRAKLGLRRPLAESVLEVDAALDPNPAGADGRPVALEYIVLAQVSR